jgi:hypothetical protein
VIKRFKAKSLVISLNHKADLDTRDVGSVGKERSACCTIFAFGAVSFAV